MKVSIVLFLIACIIVLFYLSDKITFVDVIIFLCVSYISNRTISMIGEYIKIKREQRRFELILERIERNLECRGIR